MAMFEVDAESGFSTSEIKMPVGMVDEVKWPEISKDRKESQDRKDRAYPGNGFKLKLSIRYDNLFASQFCTTSSIICETMYLLIFFYYLN